MTFFKTVHKLHLQHGHIHIIYQINNSYSYFHIQIIGLNFNSIRFSPKQLNKTKQYFSHYADQSNKLDETYKQLIEQTHTFNFRFQNDKGFSQQCFSNSDPYIALFSILLIFNVKIHSSLSLTSYPLPAGIQNPDFSILSINSRQIHSDEKFKTIFNKPEVLNTSGIVTPNGVIDSEPSPTTNKSQPTFQPITPSFPVTTLPSKSGFS